MYRIGLIFLLTLGVQAHAQRKSIGGFLKDSLTLLPITGGNIINLTTGKTIRTDGNGFFRLDVYPEDIIYARAKDYMPDTLRISYLNRDTITIFLPPTGEVLQNITVSSGYQKYQEDSLLRRREFEKARGQTYTLIDQSRHEGFGLVVNLDRLFKKKYKHQKKEERAFDESERQAYIDFRFSPQLISFYTGLKGDTLLNFVGQYRPSYEWLRNHPYKEQVIDYLSQKLKLYHQASRSVTFAYNYHLSKITNNFIYAQYNVVYFECGKHLS
jgi:hypothetical protein